MLSLLKKIFGSANDRAVKRLLKPVELINGFEPELKKLSDQELKSKTSYFKTLLAQGKTLEDIAYEAFAVVRETARRTLGQRHFDVQLMGGLVLHKGMITEMRTGEGKTLVATLPAYLNALSGKGVHVVTVNDYLAKRDSEWMGTIYNFLGLSVGAVISGISEEQRKIAYNADITYATNNELGFDYLRDNMKFYKEAKVQRDFHYAIIDEIDSILIDEARTPLIISGPVDDYSKLYVVINKFISKITPKEYDLDDKSRSVNLNEQGINLVEEFFVNSKLIRQGTSLYDIENMHLVHYVNQSLRANILFKKDIDYIVHDNKVMIIDEFTGRVMEGRRFSDGLHQALEAKENVTVQNENQTLASITFQNYFRMYPKLSGMTGTAMTEASEFKDIYNLDVVSIPTHNPIKRIDHDDEIYGTLSEKYDAILKLIKERHAKGQPILVGTVSIEKSETISALLSAHKIPHNVLNAKHHENEAFIIVQAGRYKAVTIATNMAGRGTDIKLGGNPEMHIKELENKFKGAPQELEKQILEINNQVEQEKQQVIDAGGLLVIGTERYENRRVDDQLRGRCGRQGDPGETKFFLSLEDDLMKRFASDSISGILRSLGLKDGEPVYHPMINRALAKAQQKVEAFNYEIRKSLLKFDDVMNDQRRVIYAKRNDIMESEEVTDYIYIMAENVVKDLIARYVPRDSYKEAWDLASLEKEIQRIFSVSFNYKKLQEQEISEAELENYLINIVNKFFDNKLEAFGPKLALEGTRYIFLVTLDQVWKDHLLSLDHLRQGINLRAYGQKDPLLEYKKEAFELFDAMLGNFAYMFVSRMAHLHFDLDKVNLEELPLKKRSSQKTYESRTDPAFNKYNAGTAISTPLKQIKGSVSPEDRAPNDPSTWGKVSRNESCPCGSGKKYKYCHG